jgi:hypothetical protein
LRSLGFLRLGDFLLCLATSFLLCLIHSTALFCQAPTYSLVLGFLSPSPARHVQLTECIPWIRLRRCERRSLYNSYSFSASTLFKCAILCLLDHRCRSFLFHFFV